MLNARHNETNEKPDLARPIVAETILDIPETIIEDDHPLISLTGDIAFDISNVSTSEGQIAECMKDETFFIHTDDVIGSGSQGLVFRATDTSGSEYAAKISYPVANARDRRNRKDVLDYLISLMNEHPLGGNHYKNTHLMPVYAFGNVSSNGEIPAYPYDVTIMAYCDSSLGDGEGCSYKELRDIVIPEVADGLSALHVQGIVHRDINPKNLYYLNGTIVLGDYGISSFLDSGKDTGATVLDKRTPGYSPHSSVIQRENDWYALGYTIWTLYNRGIHPHQSLIDAGDLSSIFAGKRPVEFIPNSPNESSLGDLIYGLTLESARGRLGYDSIKEWLENPEDFHFDDPFVLAEGIKSYQFNGSTYSDRSSLADAMSLSWEEAKEHLYTHVLEDYFKNNHQQDIAVALSKITTDRSSMLFSKNFGLSLALTLLKNSNELFNWNGSWQNRHQVAERMFATLSTTPYCFYEFCSDKTMVRDALCQLIAAYYGVRETKDLELTVRAALEDIEISNDDTLLMGDKLLTLFEILCENKAPVRIFFVNYGIFGNAVWIKKNIFDYRCSTDEAMRTVKDIQALSIGNPATESIRQIRDRLIQLDSYTTSLMMQLPKNPFLKPTDGAQVCNVVPLSTKAFACAHAYGEHCTIGYAMTIVSPEEYITICDFEALREDAVNKAKERASRIRAEAQRLEVSSLIGGRSYDRHIIYMILTFLVLVLGLDVFKSIFPLWQLGYETYQPLIQSDGGFTIENYISIDGCTLYLSLIRIGFTVTTLLVLMRGLVQSVPVVFSSFLKKRELRLASRIDSEVNRLESQSLVKIVDRLLKEGSSYLVDDRAENHMTNDDIFEQIQGIVTLVYRVAIVALIIGIVGILVADLPYVMMWQGLGVGSNGHGVMVLMFQFWIAVVSVIYCIGILRKLHFLPSLSAVVLMTLLLIIPSGMLALSISL